MNNLYKVGDTIKSGHYKGFVVVKVSKGWYRVYHPSNVKESCSQENAETSIRWFWAEYEEQSQF